MTSKLVLKRLYVMSIEATSVESALVVTNAADFCHLLRVRMPMGTLGRSEDRVQPPGHLHEKLEGDWNACLKNMKETDQLIMKTRSGESTCANHMTKEDEEEVDISEDGEDEELRRESFTSNQEIGALISIDLLIMSQRYIVWHEAKETIDLGLSLKRYELLSICPPEAPINCSVGNGSTSVVEVICYAGYNGGLNQTFVMEVYDEPTRQLRANVTNEEEPRFVARNLPAGSSFYVVVYAANAKGASTSLAVAGHTARSRLYDESGSPLGFIVSPLVIILIGIVIFCIFVAIIILTIVWRRKKPIRKGKVSENTQSQARIQKTEVCMPAQNNYYTDEKNPDIIPYISGVTGKKKVNAYNVLEYNNAANTVLETNYINHKTELISFYAEEECKLYYSVPLTHINSASKNHQRNHIGNRIPANGASTTKGVVVGPIRKQSQQSSTFSEDETYRNVST
ncbi:hypothetical protein GQR58_010013 [Nymphon striatum]|nr:hypothetical protein GQR58_010013 [Nymphon striatum]